MMHPDNSRFRPFLSGRPYALACIRRRLVPILGRVKKVLHLAAVCALALWLAWGAGVAFFCCPCPGWALGCYLAAVVGLIALRRKSRRWSVLGLIVLALAASVVYATITPSNNRAWQASWSRMPAGTVCGDTLTLTNVRDFRYRSETEFDVRYITQTFSLAGLRTLDLGVSRWDGMEAVAHTMLSFGFDDGRHLAVSIETRLDETDVQGSLPGLYKRFELLYIFATEEDLFGLRTNYRHEDLCLYRLRVTQEEIRGVLLSLVQRANALVEQPEFYNTLTHNCTTSLLPVLHDVFPSVHYNLAATFNGFADRRAFRKGKLVHKPGETFEELKRRSLIPADTAKNHPEQYARAIRRAIGMES